jgi:hypothetical protein
LQMAQIILVFSEIYGTWLVGSMFAKYFHLFIRALAASTTHWTWKLKTRQNKLYIMLKCQSRSIVKTGVYT